MSFHALIIGSSGQVAHGLRRALDGRHIVSTSSSGAPGTVPLDLGNPGSIENAIAGIQFPSGPVEVFLAGAMTHVDRCEQEKERCRLVNFSGVEAVAKAARKRGFGLTYFSTEYVFGGAEYEGGPIGPFSEEDKPNPTSWYGQCKLDAERAVQEIYGDSALIVRTTMVFSWDEKGMNFLMQYLRRLQDFREGKEGSFRVPVDQISTPTYAPVLADSTVKLRERSMGGIFNLVGSDLLSRKELVFQVAKAFGFTTEEASGAFQFVKTADLGQAAKRPLTAGLKSDKARKNNLPVYSLAEAFKEIAALKG